MANRQRALGLLFALPAVSAFACTSPISTDAENVADADAIFLAHIYRLEERTTDAPLPDGMVSLFGLDASFRRIDVLKGNVPSAGTIATNLSNCYAPLLPGSQYVLFARFDEQGRMVVQSINQGTQWFLGREDESIEYLNTLRRLISLQDANTP